MHLSPFLTPTSISKSYGWIPKQNRSRIPLVTQVSGGRGRAGREAILNKKRIKIRRGERPCSTDGGCLHPAEGCGAPGPGSKHQPHMPGWLGRDPECGQRRPRPPPSESSLTVFRGRTLASQRVSRSPELGPI